MNVIDSSAWLEYFADAPNAGRFASAIEAVEDLIVPSICIAEVFKRVLQQRDEQSALNAAALMQHGKVDDLTAETAIHAARLGLTLKLPFADSIVLATAHKYDATLWTQDSDFEGIDGVKYFPKRR